jgi:hypothetical protein
LGVIEVFKGVYVSPVRNFEESDACLINPPITNKILLLAISRVLPESFVVTDRLITAGNDYSPSFIIKLLGRFIPQEHIIPVEILRNPTDRRINISDVNWPAFRESVEV